MTFFPLENLSLHVGQTDVSPDPPAPTGRPSVVGVIVAKDDTWQVLSMLASLAHCFPDCLCLSIRQGDIAVPTWQRMGTAEVDCPRQLRAPLFLTIFIRDTCHPAFPSTGLFLSSLQTDKTYTLIKNQ